MARQKGNKEDQKAQAAVKKRPASRRRIAFKGNPIQRHPRIIIEADEELQQHLRVIAAVEGYKSLREFILVQLAVAYPELAQDVNRQYNYRQFFDLPINDGERINDGY